MKFFFGEKVEIDRLAMTQAKRYRSPAIEDKMTWNAAQLIPKPSLGLGQNFKLEGKGLIHFIPSFARVGQELRGPTTGARTTKNARSALRLLIFAMLLQRRRVRVASVMIENHHRVFPGSQIHHMA